MREPLLHFNGIDGLTGEPALAPRPPREFLELVKQLEVPPTGERRRMRSGLDASDLVDAGWGVIWPKGTPDEVREALAPLLARRREQATRKKEDRFQEFTYQPGESPLQFWRRHGVSPAVVDPDEMPYYLLVVGEPTDIPFEFQMELGIPHAVGRLSFGSAQDCGAEDYAAYAQQVYEAEARPAPAPRTLAFWGVENPYDEPTRASVEHLIRPLELTLASDWSSWKVSTLLRGAADKGALATLLAGEPPSLLFTASHAVRYPAGSARQATHQGALISADWPGKRAWRGRGPIPDDFLFSGEDIAGAARLDGMIAFHFACYSAGTPHLNPYEGQTSEVAAPHPFVAHLPKRLLRQGALAVVGHVDVTFEQSFRWDDGDSQPVSFRSALEALMSGAPVGHAMESFSERYGLLGAILAAASWQALGSGSVEEYLKRLQHWSAFHDSRHYLVLGDPAARLSV